MKPGFFSNEVLAELPYEARLCFAGLWTLADREGRLEDRPRRIKAALFPYDELDVDVLLDRLAGKGFVVRYAADGAAYLAIPTFLEHQRPKADEYPSVIPAPIYADPRGKARARPQTGDLDIRESDRGQREVDSGADVAPLAADGAVRRRADEFMALWNETIAAPLSRCRDLTSKRRRQVTTRLTERPLEEWRAIFQRIQASTFCRGETDRGDWRASFDWVIGSPDVAVKVLEGKYDNRQKAAPVNIRAWVCPHIEPCSARYQCDINSRLDRPTKVPA